MPSCCRATVAFLLLPALFSTSVQAPQNPVPPEAFPILDKIYSFDLEGASEDAKNLQQQRPDHPLGYILEADALWWRIWCTSAEFKYGMTDARRRPKLPSDQRYFDLAATAASLAAAQLKQGETPEMHFYAGMADATAARLYALRGESRNAARFGVRAREHLLRAKALDSRMADADFGLGLYDYYVDTLSAMARILRFFMGIPGGSREEGVRFLNHAIAEGALTPSVARFYLALNLHRYDQQYERALQIIDPLVEKYPSNPLFQLARGDLYAKLGRKPQALASYRAAESLPVKDSDCRQRIQQLVGASVAALGLPEEPAEKRGGGGQW